MLILYLDGLYIKFRILFQWVNEEHNQMRLYYTYFNFCRNHKGLTKEKESGVLEKKTPAQESEIIKKKRRFTELLTRKNNTDR
jgi:hypothetical protein